MIRFSTCVLLSMALSACNVLPTQPADSGAGKAEDSLIASNAAVAGLVAADLVNALRQIDTLDPEQTTLYARRPENRFDERMIKSLQDAGYRLRLATNEQEPLLTHAITPDNADARYTVIVSAGVIKVKRRYEINRLNQTIQPVSSIFVFGASGDDIQIDDSIFSAQGNLQAEEQAPSLTTRPVEIATVTAIPNKIEPVKQPIVASNAEDIVSRKPRTKFNMYEARQSNFKDILDEFNTVRREVMIFPNDSLVMGQKNKSVALAMVDKFNPDSDVISVIGCSHGKSAIDDGNRKLANGRAERVTEAFTIAGVSPELVLHEACWANVHFDEMMPRRGVVVTHKRRI